MRHGPQYGSSSFRRRDAGFVAAVLLGLLLMADPATALERVFAPSPAPLQGALAAGPYNFQFTGEDNIRLTVVNSLAGVRIACAYRTAPTPTTTQANEQPLAPTSDRVATTTDFSIGEGYLLNLTVYASSGAPKIGHTFVKVDVIRGMGASAKVLATILAGYITANQAVAWPGSPIRSSLEGDGLTRTVTGTDPAPNVSPSDTVPTGALWEIVSYFVDLTTVAGGANRQIGLFVKDGGVNVYVGMQFGTVVPSDTAHLQWAQGLAFQAAPHSQYLVAGLPIGLRIPAAGVLTLSGFNLAAGDDYGAPHFTVREYLQVD